MKRKLLNELIDWKKTKKGIYNKPAFITGSRGVGKTYLAFDFSKAFFSDQIYINFERNVKNSELFENEDPLVVLESLEEYFQVSIKDTTILILDEITVCQTAINFLIQLPKINRKLNIIAISTKPIQYIDRFEDLQEVITPFKLFPFDFEEYLWCMGYEWYSDVIREHFISNRKVPDIVHKELNEFFEQYLILGGMPIALNEYINSEAFINVSEQHHIIMETLHSDAENHMDESTSIKVKNILNTMDYQMMKKNKKFQYKLIRKGASKGIYKDAIHYMEIANIMNKIVKLDSDHFKLYLCDVGMQLSMIKEQNHKNEEDPEEKLNLKKGLIETYIAQNLMVNHKTLYFWESNAQAKIDFLIKDESGNLLPIEVSMNEYTRSKSLSVFKSTYQLDKIDSIKLSINNFAASKNVKYVPFYAVFCI